MPRSTPSATCRGPCAAAGCPGPSPAAGCPGPYLAAGGSGSCPPAGCAALGVLRWQFRLVHLRLEHGLDACVAETGRRRPDLLARASVTYAHSVVREDLSVHGLLVVGGVPLALGPWRGRTGLSELPPIGGRRTWQAWSTRLVCDLALLRVYAQAVHAATDAALAADPHATAACAPYTLRLLGAIVLTAAASAAKLAALAPPEPPA